MLNRPFPAKAVLKLGRIVATPGVLEAVPIGDIQIALHRHQHGDWGELSLEDQVYNNRALKEGCRILSAYKANNKTRFWLITEVDRSATTVLLPSEY